VTLTQLYLVRCILSHGRPYPHRSVVRTAHDTVLIDYLFLWYVSATNMTSTTLYGKYIRFFEDSMYEVGGEH
jgi:hypothetical protein